MGLFSRKKTESTAAPAGNVTLSSGEVVSIKTKVDCIGDSCPRPQLMTKKAVGQLGSGEVVEVMIDNPTSVEALPPMCNEMDATHLETVTEGRCWKVYIRKD